MSEGGRRVAGAISGSARRGAAFGTRCGWGRAWALVLDGITEGRGKAAERLSDRRRGVPSGSQHAPALFSDIAELVQTAEGIGVLLLTVAISFSMTARACAVAWARSAASLLCMASTCSPRPLNCSRSLRRSSSRLAEGRLALGGLVPASAWVGLWSAAGELGFPLHSSYLLLLVAFAGSLILPQAPRSGVRPAHFLFPSAIRSFTAQCR